jgi:hypothetical protein
MNTPVHAAVLSVGSLIQKSTLLAEPRNVLSGVGAGATPFLPNKPKGLSTLPCRPQGITVKRVAPDKADEDERSGMFAGGKWTETIRLLFP